MQRYDDTTPNDEMFTGRCRRPVKPARSGCDTALSDAADRAATHACRVRRLAAGRFPLNVETNAEIAHERPATERRQCSPFTAVSEVPFEFFLSCPRLPSGEA